MADDAGAAEEAPITFIVKTSTDKKYTMTLPLSTLVSDLKQKLETAEPDKSDKSDDAKSIPADRQRLIYSGRILKDHETLGSYKIKDGHTIHMVGNASSNQNRGNTTAQSSSAAASAGATPNPVAAGVPTNMAAGTGNNPLAGLTGARYAGFAQLPGAGLFGPDGGMGPPPDTESMLNMLENPQFQSTINEALQNPAMIDMMIQQNPMLRDMGPGVRQMFQSPEFRRMLTDPNSIRQMMQMQRMMGMGGGGLGGLGGGGDSAFPAPGVTNTTAEDNQNAQQQNPPPNPFGQMPPNPAGNPFAALFGPNPFANPAAQPSANAGGSENNQNQDAQSTDRGATAEGQNPEAAQNPFASLFNPALFGNAGQGGMNPLNPQQNPFLRDPALMTQMMQAMGGQGAEGATTGANPLASLFGGGFGGGFGAPQPPDNRPPEERYADQLRQLNDMGFYEFERNVEALRRAGGSVQGAVEYLLSNPS
ncbi:Ubiquitin-like protein DskB [Penicillium argentinense]|uniref:Ubiquitin-like protein DskB n=1 Tax=Penicillium argentinense TaxID=1131581 RepID=A0A9W9JVE0_9EURO|nr:Ubiquitin-like protein DskB [Penicillium argentinense]KAJ5082993.1 Ubiquitin-like protein DskB [Penicillium argentinense]